MFERLKALALRFAQVPPEPHAPAGSPGSLRVFRAAANYWKYLLVLWGLRHIVGAFVVVALLSFSAAWESANRAAPDPGLTPAAEQAGKPRRMSPEWQRKVPGVIHTLELLGLGAFLLQIPFSLAATRLNYEMRWYIVTDRSLRIREGIFGVREMTLTFANVQNISIRQGPLQRFMGIADVVVQTAGGGGAAGGHGHEGGGAGSTMHTGTLRAVDNAEQVRDLILDRLRRLRDAGLGDPDDRHHAAPDGAAALRDAARELLAAARALLG